MPSVAVLTLDENVLRHLVKEVKYWYFPILFS